MITSQSDYIKSFMNKKLYSILVMVMLAVLSGVALTACGDDDDDEPKLENGITLAGTHWYNNDYGLTFTSNTEAKLAYRNGGADYYKVEKADIHGTYNGYPWYLRNKADNIPDWMFVIDGNTIKMSTLTGSSKITLYKNNTLQRQ